MMWHFYEIPYIPDLELVKYQSLGEQGIDGILERHNRFLRQWQRNTVLIHTTLHFFLSYTHERPKGSRLQIFLAFSSDQTVNFESIDALMQASPLADYYKIAPIEDVPVCLRKSFTNILLVKKQEQTRLSTGDTLFTVEGWKSNPKSRLYEMELAKQHDAEAEARRSQIGTGDRSEKIRTYNFPQGRVTDHRIKLTLHRLENVLNGDLDEIIDSLIAADQAAKLSNLQDAE